MPDALVSVRKRPLTGSVFTVFLHVLLIAILVHQTQQVVSMGNPPSRPLYMQILADPGLRDVAPPVSVALPPLAQPKLPVLQPPPAPNAITPPSWPEEPAPVPPKPEPATAPTPIPPGMDMSEYLAQRRAQRLQEQGLEPPPPTREEMRAAAIRRNLQGGTNGVFQILRINNRAATFVFRGWTSALSNVRRETFEVEASPETDVQLAVIRKMIEIIRRHYQADFNWESDRLGKVVVLSARPQDTAGLEAFMMREFFGPESR